MSARNSDSLAKDRRVRHEYQDTNGDVTTSKYKNPMYEDGYDLAKSSSSESPNTSDDPCTDDEAFMDEAELPVTVDKASAFDKHAFQKVFIVGLDFGTTCTSVSTYVRPSGQGKDCIISPADVSIISNFPGDPVRQNVKRMQVPTEIWYPSKPIPKDRAPLRNRFVSGDDEDDSQVSDSEDGEYIDLGDDDYYDYVMDDSDYSDNEIHPQVGGGIEEDSDEIYWGFEVPHQQFTANCSRGPDTLVIRSKLMLIESEHTRPLQDQLNSATRLLKSRGVIHCAEDIICDFFILLLRHVRQELISHHGYYDGCPVEFAMTVPTVWSAKSSRTMQNILESAIHRSNFGQLRNGSINNLFITTEPEAAANFVLASNSTIGAGECFVLLDVGGGTADGSTYSVTDTVPLKLKREEVEPSGDVCGSSLLNDAFDGQTMQRLKDEKYLDTNGVTRRDIVSRLTQDFEDMHKRNVDITKTHSGIKLRIPGLRPNDKKGFTQNFMKLTPQHYAEIFKPILRRVKQVMFSQLTRAKEKDLRIKKVILIGGFAANPSLCSYLKMALRMYHIRLVEPPPNPEAAIASGAVLCALNRSTGPERIVQSSFGFLRHEPYEPEEYKAHRGVQTWLSPLDGEVFVRNTIKYFVTKGKLIPNMILFKPFEVCHTFSTHPKERFICEEVLYVSDNSTSSHYQRSHPKNKGAEIAGKIEVDMTFLKTKGLIQPIVPGVGSAAKPHYRVEFELVVIVEGRNMRYEARYPAGGKALQTSQVCIAAAFRPGTK